MKQCTRSWVQTRPATFVRGSLLVTGSVLSLPSQCASRLSFVVLALGLSACGGNGGDVTAPQASQLAFTVQPSAGKAEQVLPPFEVSVLDASGGPVAEGTYTVTLTVENNPSSAALGGMTSVASAGGRAAFASVSVSSAGNGFTL